jgi:hypothetical protein
MSPVNPKRAASVMNLDPVVLATVSATFKRHWHDHH